VNWRGAPDLLEDLLELLGVERLPALESLELAVEANDRRLAHLEVDVACAAVDGVTKHPVQIHARRIGSRTLGLERRLLHLSRR